MYIALTEQELDALQGTDYALSVLYLYIKRFMDYDTLIVGYKRRVSYQGMSEALYIEPRQGVKGGSPHQSAIRRMVDQLLKSGLLKKSRKDTLVFKLPLAMTDYHVQKKADRKSTPIADTHEANKQANLAGKADTPKKAKADTPHLSLNTISNTTTTNNLLSSDQTESSSSHLIFSKRLDTKTTQSMQKLVNGFNADQQQELIDEVQGYIERGKVQSTPLALLHGMVERCKLGAFNPSYAGKVKLARDNRLIEAQQAIQPKPVSKPKDQSKVVNLKNFLDKKVKTS